MQRPHAPPSASRASMETPALPPLLLFLLILFPLTAAAPSGSPPRCLDSERTALLQFKAGLRDPEGRLSSWRGDDCCRWSGVACDNRTGAVVKLDLRNRYPFDPFTIPQGLGNLSGRVDPSLLRLRSLAFLDLEGNWFGGGAIPAWLGSMRQLRHLDLSDAGFAGAVPPQLGDLSSLQYLDVSSSSSSSWSSGPSLYVESSQWLSGLSSLRFLAMDLVDLSRVDSAELFHLLNSELPSLAELHLDGCRLSGIPHSLTPVNFASLAVIDLSWNTFSSGTIPTWLLHIPSLVSLRMINCGLHGTIPSGLLELPNMERLFLDSNSLSGGVPSSIGKLCNLRYLYLSSNNFTGELPQTLDHSDACTSGPLSSLVELELSDNRLSGNLPDWLGELKSIKDLGLDSNMFSSSLPLSLGKRSELVIFSASDNQLTGAVSEAHFAGLKNLQSFYVGGNPALELNMSSGWTPPFQLVNLFMGSCKLGPEFPSWIKNQKRLQQLDLSNAGISDAIPTWFWGLSPELQELDLSSNSISGSIPESVALMKGLTSLDLSNNRFSGSVPSSLASMPAISFLNLSGNNFSGEIPHGGRMTKVFNISAFRDNPHLCGPPTDVPCSDGDPARSGRAAPGEEDRHCRCHTTAIIAHLLLGICALGIAALLLHVSIGKCRGLFQQDAEAKATPASSHAVGDHLPKKLVLK